MSTAISVLILSTLFTYFIFFFFNDTATTEIYTLSLHDALPICSDASRLVASRNRREARGRVRHARIAVRACRTRPRDRKSTRLNSSHVEISYAVFCLKKKKTNKRNNEMNQKKN